MPSPIRRSRSHRVRSTIASSMPCVRATAKPSRCCASTICCPLWRHSRRPMAAGYHEAWGAETKPAGTPCDRSRRKADADKTTLIRLGDETMPADNKPETGGSYDYIIVGAGSAGCVLANRPTASGRYRVLLLEAGGPDRNIWIHIPIGYAKLFKNGKVNWMYQTEPEAEMNNRRIFQPRGKVLGGSSSINGLVYLRGQREDYDLWRQLGNPGWSFDDVLPYFKKSEDHERGADAYHGVGGGLSVSYPRPHELCDAFIRAGMETGLPFRQEFNAGEQEGVGYFPMTSRRGRRCSAAVAFLRPAMKRGNLTVLTDALAHQVLFEGKRAVGVRFQHEGKLHEARAGREVILSGGAINSPQLLQLSGWGPAELLQQQGIPVIENAAGVGSNLQDHLQVRMVFKCRQKITVNDDYHHLGRRVAA